MPAISDLNIIASGSEHFRNRSLNGDETPFLQFPIDLGSKCSRGREEQLRGGFSLPAFSARGAAVSAVGSADCNFLDAARVHELFKISRRKADHYSFPGGGKQECRQLLFRIPGQHPDGVEPRVERARRERRVVIYFSSVDVYGRSPTLPMNEATSLDPDTWYGLAKSTSEWIVREELGSRVSNLHSTDPGNFWRLREGRSVIGQLVASIRGQGKVCVHGDGKTLRDYVFAPDLCRVVERLVTQRSAALSISQPARVCRCCKSSKPSAKSLGSISRWFAFRPMPIGTLTCVTTPRDCRRHLENSSLRR